MNVNIPTDIRAVIYVVTVIVTAVIVPLYAAGAVNDVAFAVWTSLSGAVAGLAGLNVYPDKKE